MRTIGTFWNTGMMPESLRCTMLWQLIALKFISLMLLHPSKAPPPIIFTFSGIVSLRIPEHPAKAYLPILSRLAGNVMLVNREQYAKA